MKITINGKINKNALKSILDTQKEKTIIIDEFCKKEKYISFSYKDSELEYDYQAKEKEVKPKAPNHKNKKVETRDGKKN